MATSLSEHLWLDEKVLALGPVGIAVWCFVLSGPHTNVNLPGLYHLPLQTVQERLGGSRMAPHHVREVQDAFNRLLEARMAVYEPGAMILRIPNVWKHATTPNLNQILGWRANWLKLPESQIRYDHLPTLRLLAERNGNEAAVNLFDAKFGSIVPGDPRTYRKHHAWKTGDSLPPGTGSWLFVDPTDHIKNKNIVCLKREGEDPREKVSQSFSLLVRLPPPIVEGFEKGSTTHAGTLPQANDSPIAVAAEGGGKGSTTHSRRVREGFEKGSTTHTERVPPPIVEGFEKGSTTHGEGFLGKLVTVEEGSDDAQRRSATAPAGRGQRAGADLPNGAHRDTGSEELAGANASSGNGIVPAIHGAGRRSGVVAVLDVPNGRKRKIVLE